MELKEVDVVAPILSLLPSPDSPSLDLLKDIRALLSRRYSYLESIPILPMPEEPSGKVLREDYKEGFSIDSNFLGLTVFDFEIKDQTSVSVCPFPTSFYYRFLIFYSTLLTSGPQSH
eukprot:TRINITY_DN813_c0_g1_i1.p3 TRINITY_DN813_c0_g1~~TRINITY_DN813_c0_g1_i1.p3  ORF type:complete len:117 (+),score=24.33 TRINITY_DN813_c0_g1_i1:117-467(+)